MNITKIDILSGGESQSIYEMGVSPFRALSEIDSCEVTYIDYKSIYSEVGPRRSNSKIYRTIGEVLPDIVLWISDYHYEFDIEFFLKLSQQSFMALFVGDDENYFDKHSRYYSQAFDLVITANPLSVDRYGIYGVPAVPYYSAYNTSQIKLNKNTNKSIHLV